MYTDCIILYLYETSILQDEIIIVINIVIN